MTEKYLFDTNIIIHYMKNNQKIVEWISDIDLIHVPVLVVGGLYYGVYFSTRNR